MHNFQYFLANIVSARYFSYINVSVAYFFYIYYIRGAQIILNYKRLPKRTLCFSSHQRPFLFTSSSRARVIESNLPINSYLPLVRYTHFEQLETR